MQTGSIWWSHIQWTLWPAGTVLRTFVKYSTAFCSRPEIASGVRSGTLVRPTVPDKPVKFRDPRLNRSSEAAMSTVFHDNFWLEVVSDVMSGVDVEQVDVDVYIKFGDSRLNGSWDTRLPHFVTDDDNEQWTTPGYAGWDAKTPFGVLSETVKETTEPSESQW